MKHAPQTFWHKYVVNPIGGVLSRFPVSVAIAFVLSATVSVTILYEHSATDELFAALASLVLAFFLTVAVKLLEEKYQKFLWWAYILVALYAF